MRLARLDSGSSVLAVAGGALGDGLGLRTGLGALELLADGLDGRSAGAGDGSGTTEVGVDTGKDLTVVGLDVLDDNGAGDRVLAVTAGTVKLSEVHDGYRIVSNCQSVVSKELLTEAVNGDRSLSVVLDDLVISRLGTSALDHGVAVTLEGKSILANVDPPDVLDGAGSCVRLVRLLYVVHAGVMLTLAVDTLDLVLANDGVLEGTSVLDEEDSVLVTTLNLTCARSTTAVGLHATIESSGNLLGLLVGNRALGGGDREGGTLGEREELARGGGSRAGSGEASDGSNDGNGELHFDG